MNGIQTNGATTNGAQQNGHPLNAVYNTMQQQQQMLQNQLQQPQPSNHSSQQTPDSPQQQPQQGNGLANMSLFGFPQMLQMNPMAMAALGQLQMAQMQNATGMPQMPGFPPMIPPQVLQEVVSLSKPVDVTDESILIDALRESRNKGENFKDALNKLHGVNNHASVMWKDYFLEHMDRILATIATSPNAATHKPAPGTVKKPAHAFKRESSTPSASPSGRLNPLPKRKRESQEPRSSLPPKEPPKKRTTLNSFTTHTAVFTRTLPAPHSELKIPDPPSREPTPPPNNPLPGGRGNKYTQEEQNYFLRYISWCLKGDPTLTRKDLCTRLAEKLPHHSAGSWSSYWSNNHDLPDKIYASLTKGENSESDSEEEGSEYDSDSNFKQSPKRRRQNYRESSSEGDDEEGEHSNIRQQSCVEDSDDDDESVRSYSESEMGQQGMAYTDADLYLAGKHIASRPNFQHETNTVRWGDFAEKHNQRAFKSWVEYFRRNEKGLMSMARKIKRKEERASQRRLSIQNQRARPSWAREGNRPPHLKRKSFDMGPSTNGAQGSEGEDSESDK